MNYYRLQTAKSATLGEMAAMVAHDLGRPLTNIDHTIKRNNRKEHVSSEFYLKILENDPTLPLSDKYYFVEIEVLA
ncbi:MAG: hypothetical protein GY786_20305 [Proteobacteria bacterium]|nr:hypothetical protein [Pseudomonadota bacterium]